MQQNYNLLTGQDGGAFVKTRKPVFGRSKAPKERVETQGTLYKRTDSSELKKKNQSFAANIYVFRILITNL